MAKTAVINPRRKRRANKRRSTRRRRRNPSSRRYYGSARRRRRSNHRRPSTTHRRRRRNPDVQSVYSAGGYRQKNPDLFDVDHILSIMPAATGGIWSVRWAMKMAGDFEPETVTTASGQTAQIAVPGLKHAFAGVLAARIGSGLIAQVLGDPRKAEYAEIAALGFVGDLFARTRILRDSKWVAENLMLQGIDDADLCSNENADQPMSGQLMIGPDGQLYQMGHIATDPAQISGSSRQLNGLQQHSALNGLQQHSALNGIRRAHSSVMSSFGYGH